MERDLVRVRELYAGWETEDLIKAVTFDKADYEPGTIDIIKEELQSRNVNTEDLDSFTEDLDSFHNNYIREEESLKNEGKLFCPKCHSLNIIKKKWKWWYFLPIPIPLYAFLLFVCWMPHRKKYRCNDCDYYFRRRALKKRGSVLGNLWEKFKAEF